MSNLRFIISTFVPFRLIPIFSASEIKKSDGRITHKRINGRQIKAYTYLYYKYIEHNFHA